MEETADKEEAVEPEAWVDSVATAVMLTTPHGVLMTVVKVAKGVMVATVAVVAAGPVDAAMPPTPLVSVHPPIGWSKIVGNLSLKSILELSVVNFHLLHAVPKNVE